MNIDHIMQLVREELKIVEPDIEAIQYAYHSTTRLLEFHLQLRAVSATFNVSAIVIEHLPEGIAARHISQIARDIYRTACENY